MADDVTKRPRVSVILPAYNCETFIADAIGSILGQTFCHFELLVIDDASTDTTVEIIRTFNDPRLRIFEKPKNTGYTESLNYGLNLSKGEYIARMDADDISFPKRFEKQVAFMDHHQEVVACGTFYRVLGSEKVKEFPTDHEDLKIQLLQETCFAHPTVMIRKAVLDKNNVSYDVTKEPAEDYALWVRLLEFGKFYNLQDVLLDYRVHDQQVSVTRRSKQLKSKGETRVNILRYLNINIDTYSSEVLEKIFSSDQLSFEEILTYCEIKQKLINANNSLFFGREKFKNYMNGLESQVVKNYFLVRSHFYPRLFKNYLYFKKQGIFALPFFREIVLLGKSVFYYKKNRH